MQRMPALVKFLYIALCLPLMASANPEQTGKSDCKSLVSHSGFAEFVMPREGGTHKMAIKASASVKWTIRNSDYVDWISILDGGSGMGPGTMTIQLEANPGKNCRVGELTISGLLPIYGLPIKILQQGTETVTTESPEERSIPWLIELEPLSNKNPQILGKRELKKTTRK